MSATLRQRLARARRIAAKALLLAALLAVATVAGQEVVAVVGEVFEMAGIDR